MDRRIFGLETGYGVTCTFGGGRRLSPDEVAGYLFGRVLQGGSGSVLLRNGARLFLDVRSRPEYATPECDNVLDLVAHDKAGERVLEDLLVDAGRRLREDGVAGDVYVFKNDADPAGNSDGCREYYLAGRYGEFGRDVISARVLEMWERALGAIEAGDLDLIAREIDWVTKYQLIERYRAGHDLPLSSPRVARLDLAYHDVRRGRGQYYLLQRSGAVARVVRDLDIFEAKSVPPHGHPPM